MLNKTLGDLKSDIQLWLNRTDPEVVNAIPAFVTLAEQEFSRAVKIPMDEGQFLYNAVGGGSLAEFVPIPTDMLSPIGVSVGSFDTGKATSYTRIDGYAIIDIINKGTDTGHYFAKYNEGFIIYPSLQENDIVSFIYHKDLTPMVSDGDASPALTYGYDLMLYWSLKHASVFLRDPEQEQYWTEKASEALVTMQNTFEEMHWSGSPKQILGY